MQSCKFAWVGAMSLAGTMFISGGHVHASPVFVGLAGLSGQPASVAYGLSGDGAVVVGTSGSLAIRWVNGGDPQVLGTLVGGSTSFAYGASADGSAIAGYGTGGLPSSGRAFRWTPEGGIQNLGVIGNPPGVRNSQGNAISADGSTVVGRNSSSIGQRAFRWTGAGGMEDLGVMPDFDEYSIAFGVSGNGSVVTGYAGGEGGVRAFRWTGVDGMQSIGTLMGSGHSYGYAINGDGSVIAGASGEGFVHAFRWQLAGGMQDLGTVPGTTNSFAYAVSADGLVLAGACSNSNGTGDPLRAFLWSAQTGMVDLNTYLPTLGINLDGWTLIEARGLSADGSAIAGRGFYNGVARGWVVTGVPAPSAAVAMAAGGLVTARRRRCACR